MCSILAVSCGDNLTAEDRVARATLFGAPALVAYQSDETSWRTLSISQDGTYLLHFRTGYRFLAVCDDSLGTRLVQHFGADESDLLLGSCAGDGPTRPLFKVTGQMLQAGDVSLGGGVDSSSVSPWGFSLDAFSDGYDLVATDGLQRADGRISIVRDIEIMEDTILPTIDLAEGSYLETAALEVDGVDDDELSVNVMLVTRGGWPAIVSSVSSTKQVQFVPPTLLKTSDVQNLEISADHDYPEMMTSRTSRVAVKEAVPSLSLLPSLSDSVFRDGGMAVDPAAVPLSDYKLFAIESLGENASGKLVNVRVSASRSWVESNNAALIRLDDRAPSIPSWSIVDLVGYAAELVCEDENEFRATAVIVNVPSFSRRELLDAFKRSRVSAPQ